MNIEQAIDDVKHMYGRLQSGDQHLYDLPAMIAAITRQDRRMFPIQHGPSVPWGVMAPHDYQCQKNHGGQTLERIAQRGGLSPCEAWYVVNGLKYDDHGAIAARFKWIEYAERINLHYNELDQLRKELAEAKAVVEKLRDCEILYGADREEDSEAGEPSAVEFPTENGSLWWGDEDFAYALHAYREAALAAKEASHDTR